jgi:hypothetical protein
MLQLGNLVVGYIGRQTVSPLPPLGDAGIRVPVQCGEQGLAKNRHSSLESSDA